MYVIIMSRTRFWVNLHSIVGWMSWNSLLKTGTTSESNSNGIRTHNHFVCKRTLNYLAKLSTVKWFNSHRPWFNKQNKIFSNLNIRVHGNFLAKRTADKLSAKVSLFPVNCQNPVNKNDLPGGNTLAWEWSLNFKHLI